MASPVEVLNGILNEWHEKSRSEGFIPLKTLESLCEVVEEQTDIFYKGDPDPFDERHPARIDPEGGLGLVLKAILKHDDFMNKLVNDYMNFRNYSPQGENSVLSASCRLFLDILPGMETSFVLSEADGLLNRLYEWAEKAEEPLSSYAIGIISSAMEIQELAGESKEKNARLVPILLKKLKTLLSTDSDFIENNSVNKPFTAIFGQISNFNQNIIHDDVSQGFKRKKSNSPRFLSNSILKENDSKKRIKINESGDHIQDTNSNSNWADMQPHIIGSYKMSPLTSEMKQRIILKYLTALGGYQEHVPAIFEHDALNLLFDFIEMASSPNFHDACLTFKSLHYLASLFVHKKFALAFINAGGLQKLLNICRPSMAATGVSLCLYYLAYYEEAMEKICQLPHSTLQKLVEYVLWLLVCSHQSGRTHAVLFFSVSFSFKVIVDIFDSQDGLRKLFNILSTLDILNNEIETAFMSEDDLFVKRQSCRYTIIALKKYFETHFLLLSSQSYKYGQNNNNEIAVNVADVEMDNSNHSGSNFSILTVDTRNQSLNDSKPLSITYKPVKSTPQILLSAMKTIADLYTSLNDWKPMQEFLCLGGIPLLLKIIMLAGDWMFHGRAELVRNALDILKFATFIQPSIQLQLCKSLNFSFGDESHQSSLTGISTILMMAEGTIVSDPEAQKSALSVIINCVSGQVNGLKTPVLINNKRRSTKSSEDVLHKMWKSIRDNNGLMVLLNLLSIKTPLTDADEIRYLACKALYGLMRSETLLQIASKLPIFNNGQLQHLMKEPVLQDNLAIHLQFCQYAKQLLQTIKGQKSPSIAHLSLDQMHRANVVAQTKINFSKKELLHLMYNYLLEQGLKASSSALIEEAWDVLFSANSDDVTSSMTFGICLPPNNYLNALTNSQQPYGPIASRNGISQNGPNNYVHMKPFPSRTAAFKCITKSLCDSESPKANDSSNANGTLKKSNEERDAVTHLTSPQPAPGSIDTVITHRRSSKKKVGRKKGDKSQEKTENEPIDPPSIKKSKGEKLKLKLSIHTPCSNPKARILYNTPKATPSFNGSFTEVSEVRPNNNLSLTSTGPSINANQSEGKKPNWQRSDSIFYQQSPALRKLHNMQRLGETSIKLENIITEYLREQHSHCQNPMGTCPPFSLLAPHQCPIPRNSRSASLNITKRHSHIPIFPLFGGLDGKLLDKKYVYSRLKGNKVIKDPEEEALFTCCTFQKGNANVIYIGTEAGEIRTYNVETGAEDTTYVLGNIINPIHWCRVAPTHSTIGSSALTTDKNDSIIATYSFEQWRPCAYVWNLADTTQHKYLFENCHHPVFNNSGLTSRLLATENEKAHIYDLYTGTKIVTLYDASLSNMYAKNRAVFNLTDDYVLSDGILWDSESGHAVHKFDKLNPNISGVFHPNGFEVIINTEVTSPITYFADLQWDMRTYKLLNTVPSLDQCRINFNPTNDIIYALLHVENEDEIGGVGTDDEFGMKSCFDTSVRVLDANTYTSLVTVDTRKTIFDLCPDTCNKYVAIVESCSKDNALDALLPRHDDDDDRLCRLYEIGRSKDVQQEAEEEETEGEHELDSDGSSDEDDDEYDDYTITDPSDYTSNTNDDEDSSYETISSDESNANSRSSRRPQSNMTTTTSTSSTLYNLNDPVLSAATRSRNSHRSSGRRNRGGRGASRIGHGRHNARRPVETSEALPSIISSSVATTTTTTTIIHSGSNQPSDGLNQLEVIQEEPVEEITEHLQSTTTSQRPVEFNETSNASQPPVVSSNPASRQPNRHRTRRGSSTTRPNRRPGNGARRSQGAQRQQGFRDRRDVSYFVDEYEVVDEDDEEQN